MPNLHRIALFGTGVVAADHVRAVSALGERVEAFAAVNPDADALTTFADAHTIAARYTDAETCLTEFRPTIVLIATPPATHSDLAIRAMRAGADVLCEKPICGSLAQLDTLNAVERATGRTVSSVVQWRFASSGQHLHRLMAAQAFGAPRLALVQTTWYRSQAYHAVAWRGTWHTELGGVTLTLGIHAIDFLLWLWEKPSGGWTEVSAATATHDRAIEVDNISAAVVRFRHGALATIASSALSPAQHSRVRLDHQRGTLELNHLYRYSHADWTFTPAPVDDTAHAAARRAWDEFPTPDRPSSQAAQLEEMVTAIDAGHAPSVTGSEIRRTLEFVTCLYKSAALNLPIARGSISPDDPFYRSMNGVGRHNAG
jgi:predicted dehydrogenase